MQTLVFSLLFLLLGVSAQNKCEACSYLDYKMKQTLVVSSDLKLEELTFEFKFHKVDENALIAQLTIQSQKFEFYYIPRASQLCIKADDVGSVFYNIQYASFIEFELDDSSLNIAGSPFQFNPAYSDCGDPVAYLEAGPFRNNVVQLKVDTSTASDLADLLSVLTELPAESCEAVGDNELCSQCIQGYALDGQSACCKFLFEAQILYSMAALRPIQGFAPHVQTPSPSMLLPVNVQKVGGGLKLGTDALVSQNSFSVDPAISLSYGTGSWVVQTYVMILTESTNSGSMDLIKLEDATSSLVIQIHYTYNTHPSTIGLEMSFQLGSGDNVIESNKIQIPLGEWLILRLEGDQSQREYNMRIKKHGLATIQGQAHIVPVLTTLMITSEPATIYLKEFIVWDSSHEENSKIGSHKCQFTHNDSFNPKALFNLDFNPLSSTNDIVDAKGAAIPVAVIISNEDTTASLIERLQPIAQLESDFTYSSEDGSPGCVRCTPGCSACSDIYTCTTCRSDTPKGGLCLNTPLSPNTEGIADSTYYTVQIQDLASINIHIVSELRADPSKAIVAFSYFKIVYPENSRNETVNNSTFKVPIYEVEGATQFTVTIFLLFTNNEVLQEVEVGSITLTQQAYVTPLSTVIANAQDTPLDDNICECRTQQECNTATGECTCSPGYAGIYCTFTQDELQSLQTQVTDSVTALEIALDSMSAEAALTELQGLSSDASVVTDSTALKMISLTSSLISSDSTESELTQVAQVLSNSISFAQHSEAALSIIESIKDTTDQIVNLAIEGASELQINSNNLFIQVQSIDLTSPATLSPTNDLTLSLPAGLGLSTGSTVQLSSVVMKESFYQSVAPKGTNQASDTLSLQVFQDKVKQKISGLSQNIEMQFSINSRDSITQSKIQKIADGTQPFSDVTCAYFDVNSQRISSSGCSVISVTATSIKCGCNHMTDFTSFLKTGLSVLEGSNYDVLLAITQLRPSNLKTNLGVYLALGYWGSFVIFCFLVVRLD